MRTSPKILVMQPVYGALNDSGDWFRRFVEPMNRMYCEIHGYDYLVADCVPPSRDNRHLNWIKVDCIAWTFSQYDFDYLFVLDADAVFYCHSISIHDEILPLMEEKIMLAPQNCGGEEHRWLNTIINAGVFIFKKCPEAKVLIDDWNSVSDQDESEETRHTWPLEQLAFDYVYPKYTDKIQILKDYYLLQSCVGYFVRHLYGCACDDKYGSFKAIFESPMMDRNRNLLDQINARN